MDRDYVIMCISEYLRHVGEILTAISIAHFLLG